jgi:cell cycle checkpoint protein
MKDTSSMWVDKYAPTNAAQLCMAPKKVKEIRSWMQNPGASRLLVCVGSPGIGKSTMVRILASELGWTLHEWSDSIAAQYHGGGGTLLTTVDRSSSLESFQEFLQGAGAGFVPLQLSLGTKEVSVGHDGKCIIMIDEVSALGNIWCTFCVLSSTLMIVSR